MDWSVKPCSQDDAKALADALELSETTARVLVRRGYSDPTEARAFLEGAVPGHDPFLLGDMAAAVETGSASQDDGVPSTSSDVAKAGMGQCHHGL